MTRLIKIESCSSCPNFDIWWVEDDGFHYCRASGKHPEQSFLEKEIPEWCPLPKETIDDSP